MNSPMDEKHQVIEGTQSLQGKQAAHLQLGERMMKADGGNVFMMDLLAVGVLNRSVRLVKGFCDQINSNFLCAASLVRLQLDNFLRFRAANDAGSLNDFVLEVMRGTPIRKLKDRYGKPMTDAYLVEQATAEYPQIKDIYDRGCGYIHLCEVHIAHAVQASGHMQMELSVSLDDLEITDEQRRNAIGVMAYVTDLVLRHVDGWVQTKENPELVVNPMKRAEMLVETGHISTAKEWLQMVVKGHHDPSITAAEAKLASLM